jgi:hypothetical protein
VGNECSSLEASHAEPPEPWYGLTVVLNKVTVCASGLWHRLPGSLRLAGLNSTSAVSRWLSSVSLQIFRSWRLQCLGASYRGLGAGRARGAGLSVRVQQGKEIERALLKTWYRKRHPFCFGSSAYADRLIGVSTSFSDCAGSVGASGEFRFPAGLT